VRDVLRTPGALSLFASSCVARLPMGALGLLLVLHTEQLTGSYAAGGLAAGAYALALGISNPALARIVDRRGQTLVLQAGAPVAAAAIVVVALLPGSAPTAPIVACAVAAGLTQPPTGACMRALWPELLDTPDRRHAAYALEGAALEAV
jgi:MFS family permease